MNLACGDALGHRKDREKRLRRHRPAGSDVGHAGEDVHHPLSIPKSGKLQAKFRAGLHQGVQHLLHSFLGIGHRERRLGFRPATFVK